MPEPKNLLEQIQDAQMITGRDIFFAVCVLCRSGQPHDAAECRGHVASLPGARQEIVDYVNHLYRIRLHQLEDAFRKMVRPLPGD